VNDKIKLGLPVGFEILPKDVAVKSGAIHALMKNILIR